MNAASTSLFEAIASFSCSNAPATRPSSGPSSTSSSSSPEPAPRLQAVTSLESSSPGALSALRPRGEVAAVSSLVFSRRSCSSAQLSLAAPPASLQLCRCEPSFTHTLLKLPWLRSRVGTGTGASGGVLSEGLRADDSGRSCGESTEGCRIASGMNEEPADLAGGSSHSNESLRGASGGGGGILAGVLLFRPNILDSPTLKCRVEALAPALIKGLEKCKLCVCMQLGGNIT